MMKKVVVDITWGSPFWQEYYDKLGTIYGKGYLISQIDHEHYVKKWYGYEAELQPYDAAIVLHMTEQEHTLFALKYGLHK